MTPEQILALLRLIATLYDQLTTANNSNTALQATLEAANAKIQRLEGPAEETP